MARDSQPTFSIPGSRRPTNTVCKSWLLPASWSGMGITCARRMNRSYQPGIATSVVLSAPY